MNQDDHSQRVVDLLYSTTEGLQGQPDKLLSIAQANKITYPFLKHLDSTDRISATAADLLRNTRQQLDDFEDDLSLIDSLLTGNAIDYAVIKTAFPFQYVNWDVNLLIQPKDRQDVISVFTEQGWYRSSLREHPIARTEPGKIMLEHESRHPIHIHDSVSWNGISYLPADLVLDSTKSINGIEYPSESIDWLIHCAHSVFENYDLTLGEAYLLEEFDQPAEELISQYQLTEAVELVMRYRTLICSGETEANPPLAYQYRELLHPWRAHAGGISGYWELFAHHGLFCMKKIS